MRTPSAAGSRFAVGSSRRYASRSSVRTEARATRFFSPPLRLYGYRSARASIPSAASAASTRLDTSASSKPIWRGPKASSSRTVGEKHWTSASWKTSPTVLRKNLLNAPSSSDFSESGRPKAAAEPVWG